MSHKLIDLNDDLKRLRDKGYNVDIHAAYLVVRDIPYVNEKSEVVHDGILITALELSGEKTVQPGDHTIRFAGQCPCDAKGTPLNAIRPDKAELKISDKLSSQFHFSSKPARGYYIDYFDKIRTYAAILTGQAVSIDPAASPLTFEVVEPEEENSPFNYLDTSSSRADINVIAAKLAVNSIAIVGLGGTGSYVLDLISKTPVQEIHLFDGDKFASHNAFRAPGAASVEDLHLQQLKVDYFKLIYARMHRGIIAHPAYVDETNVEQLRGMTFVFLCMDASVAKRAIVEKLEEYDVPFIDTGMGLYAKNETLGGILQVTTSTAGRREIARKRMTFASGDNADEYDKNIQIADLNALNAIMAVMRWKKMQGFYFDFKHSNFSTFTIGTNQLLSEDIDEQS